LNGSACTKYDGSAGQTLVTKTPDDEISMRCVTQPLKLQVALPYETGQSVSPPYKLHDGTLTPTFYLYSVKAVDGAGAAMEWFQGTVSITSSDCPLSAAGSASHTYTATDDGTHSFSLSLGDVPYFWATCTLVVHDSSLTFSDASVAVTVSGEWCDGVDNNGNGTVDLDGYPEKGQPTFNPATGQSGVYVCTADKKGVASSV